MRSINIVLVLVLCACSHVAAQLEEEEESVAAVQEEPLEDTEEGLGQAQPSTMIGIEAYREVLASGRYKVGPGDGFMIMMGTEGPFFGEVQAEGGYLIPNAGRVQVAGLSLKEVRQAMEETYYQTFKEGKLVIELSQLRQFPINIVGAVSRPGLYVTSGVVRTSELVRQAGIGGASSRNIRILKTASLADAEWERIKDLYLRRDFGSLEGLSERVDLELYRVTGDSRLNPFVEDGDLIIVPPRQGVITLSGALERPGSFEFVAGDRASDLLLLGQGPAPYYDPEKVVLFRYADDMITMETFPVDIKGIMRKDPKADFLLREGDWLVFRSLREYREPSTASIAGEVAFPGPYVIEKNVTTLRQLVEMAGGFTKDASLYQARVFRSPDETEIVDQRVAQISSIASEDRSEEEKEYLSMNAVDIPGLMVVDFAALFKRGDETQNIRLLPGDNISVPALKYTVKVSGQAVFPGAVVHHPDYRIGDYIEKAGGKTWRASNEVRYIEGQSGQLKRARDAGRIEPGDRIWIKEKPRRDYWQIFTQATTVMGNVATVVLIFVTLTR